MESHHPGLNPEGDFVRTPSKTMVYDIETEVIEEVNQSPFQFVRRNSAIEIPRSQSKRPQ